jgi:hypothetical protein
MLAGVKTAFSTLPAPLTEVGLTTRSHACMGRFEIWMPNMEACAMNLRQRVSTSLISTCLGQDRNIAGG